MEGEGKRKINPEKRGVGRLLSWGNDRDGKRGKNEGEEQKYGGPGRVGVRE